MKRYIMAGFECGLVASDSGDLVKYNDAAAEIEKLKCCGNCAHVRLYSRDVRCELDHEEVFSDQKCKFDPSRWECFEPLEFSECLD